MGWIADMATKIRELGTAKPKASSLERLSVKLELAEVDHNQAKADVVSAEHELQAAIVAAVDSGDEQPVVAARRALREARDRAEDLAFLVTSMTAERDRMRQNHEAARRAKAMASARDAADRMTAALQQVATGADMIAAATRSFLEARDRFYEVSPVKPEQNPQVWTRLEEYIARHIGARSPVFRGAALRSGEIEALGRRSEILQLHADELRRLFGDDQPPKAA